MSQRTPQPPPDDPRPAGPESQRLAGSLEALRAATRALAASGAGPEPGPPDLPSPTGPAPAASTPAGHRPSPSDDPEVRDYYARLEQTGKIADVADDDDLTSLPPGVTHVRRPDGTIERIGYSAH